MVTSDWRIENNYYWRLESPFEKTQTHSLIGTLTQTSAASAEQCWLLFKNENTEKIGIKNKRLLVELDEKYLLKVLAENLCGETIPCKEMG